MALADLPVRTSYWDAQEHDFRLAYVQRIDLFSATAGEPREAVALEREDGLVVRVDPESYELLSIELYDFHARYVTLHPEVMALWRWFERRWTPLDRLRLRLGRPIRKATPGVPPAAVAHELAALAHPQPAQEPVRENGTCGIPPGFRKPAAPESLSVPCWRA